MTAGDAWPAGSPLCFDSGLSSGLHPGGIAQGSESRAYRGQCMAESISGLSVECGCTTFYWLLLEALALVLVQVTLLVLLVQQSYIIIQLQERDPTLTGEGGPAICLGIPGLAHSGHAKFP